MTTNIASPLACGPATPGALGFQIGQRVRHRTGWRGEIVGRADAPGRDWLGLYRVADDIGGERIAAREFLVAIERSVDLLLRAVVEVGHSVNADRISAARNGYEG